MRVQGRPTGSFDFVDSDAESHLERITKQLRSNRSLSNNTLLKALKEVAQIIESASPGLALQNAMRPLSRELANEKYCRHKNEEVRLFCGYIFGQMARLFVPNSPFEHEQLSAVFEAIVFLFRFLKNPKDQHFQKALGTLKTIAEVSFCLLLLDLDPSDLLLECIRTLLQITNVENDDLVGEAVGQVILCLLEEMEDIPERAMKLLVQPLIDTTTFPAASRVVQRVFKSEKLDASVRSFCVGLVSKGLPKEDSKPEECYKILSKFCELCSTLSLTILPHLQELLSSTHESKRLKSLEVVERFLNDRQSCVLSMDEYTTLTREFTERVVDAKENIRLLAVSSIPEIAKQIPETEQRQQLHKSCFNRLLDPSDKVRSKALLSCSRSIIENSSAFDDHHLGAVFMRLRDKKHSVRKCAAETIVELFQWFSEHEGSLQMSCLVHMGCLFEATGCVPEIRAAFFGTVSKSGLFPPNLHRREAGRLLSHMYHAFNEKQRKAFLKTVEYKHSLQAAISDFVSTLLSTGTPQSAHVSQILNFFPPSEKTRGHFLKLLESNDKRIVKKLDACCGVLATKEVWMESRKEIVSYLGSRTAAAEFYKSLCFQACPSFLPEDILDDVLMNEDCELYRKLAKLCGSLFLQRLEIYAAKLEAETRANVIELLLKSIASAAKLYRCIDPNTQQENAASRIVQHLKRAITMGSGTPKCGKYTVFILHSFMSFEDSTKFLDDVCGDFCRRMQREDFAADPISAFAIQAVATIGHLSPQLLQANATIFAEFALAIYLQSSVGVPPISSFPKTTEETIPDVEPDVILKSMAFKAIARACTPSPSTESATGNMDGIQKLAESCLGIIASLDLLNPDSNSLYRLGGTFEKSSSQLSFEEAEKLDLDKSHLRVTTVSAVLKIQRFRKTEFDNQLFRDVAFTVQDSAPNARSAAIQKLTEQMSYVLRLGQLHRCHKYAACLALAAIDPVENHKMKAKEHLKTVIALERRNVRNVASLESASEIQRLHAMPEFMLPYLVHLLAHHDDFPDASLIAEEGPTVYDPFQEMLLFLFELLLTVEMTNLGENIPIMKSLLQCIKYSHDAEKPEIDTRLYIICDIALFLLKEICTAMDDRLHLDWEKAFPGSISLPKALYKVDRQLIAVNGIGSHLPSNLQCVAIDFLKKRKSRTRFRRSTVGPELRMTPIKNELLPRRRSSFTEPDLLSTRPSCATDAEASANPRDVESNTRPHERRAKRQRRRTQCEIEEEPPVPSTN